MTKKLLSLLLVGLMVLALAPMSAFAKAEGMKVAPNAMEKFVPKKASDVATRDEVINDGSILNVSFESGEDLSGWWMVDKDGDGNNWSAAEWGESYCYDGTYAAVSRSWSSSTGALNANNWYMTPEFTVPANGAVFSFYTRSLEAAYADPIQVLIAAKGSGAYNSAHTTVVENKWTTIVETQTISTETYQQFSYDLASYANQTVTIAFRHQASDCNGIIIDYVQVGQAEDAIVETSITLDQTTLALEMGGTAQLTATIAPDEATFKDVTWSVSDASILGVNAIGGVIGLAEGTATVTATSHNGLTATCEVTVSGGYDYDDNMSAFGLFDTTWYGMNHYGYLTANQVDADSSYILAGDYNAMDGLVYAYIRNGSSGSYTYQFVSFDPANDYAKTVIANVTSSDIPSFVTYGYDTGVMYGCFTTDDGTYITGEQISEIDLTTGTQGEMLFDVYASTYEYEDDDGNTQTSQYYLVPFWSTTYVGNGYFVGYDRNYKCIILYDCSGETFDAYIMIDNVDEQAGEAFGQYLQTMYYNPVDGYLYWAAIFGNSLDLYIIDLNNGIMVPAGPTATDTDYEELTVLYTEYYYVTFVDGVTDEVISMQIVGKGDDAVAPDAPEHDGYTFDHWDGTMTGITGNTTITAVYTEAAPTGLPGDVDCNGEVTMADVTILAMYLNGENPEITEQGMINADANQDGTVDIRDIAAIYAIISAS